MPSNDQPVIHQTEHYWLPPSAQESVLRARKTLSGPLLSGRAQVLLLASLHDEHFLLHLLTKQVV